MESTDLIFRGMRKAIDEWEEQTIAECDGYAQQGWTALDCHEEVAQDVGHLKHKVSDLYGMGLIALRHFDDLMTLCDECLREVTDYIWDDLFA